MLYTIRYIQAKYVFFRCVAEHSHFNKQQK